MLGSLKICSTHYARSMQTHLCQFSGQKLANWQISEFLLHEGLLRFNHWESVRIESKEIFRLFRAKDHLIAHGWFPGILGIHMAAPLGIESAGLLLRHHVKRELFTRNRRPDSIEVWRGDSCLFNKAGVLAFLIWSLRDLNHNILWKIWRYRCVVALLIPLMCMLPVHCGVAM